ncbi:IS4 family transposase [Clostridium brassicae]|uniref:IS4 family transposase n=1 Tax=Clostridium brassicae TaxID=2999072 RepID=A0ABT4DEF5_9CLOT|nr:IS4 family transposase [Clostridium brassicae]MCY6959571.1 IS4 family transposase [Clostridium brassicae]
MAKTYFQWAEFRSTKAGIKLHTKFNLSKGVPELIIVSNAKPHDRTKMKELITENNCIYVFDKGYAVFKKFDEFSNKGIRFITRLKDNAAITEVSKLEITYSDVTLLDDSINIIEDIVCYLGTEDINMTKNQYRVITVVDSEGQILTFVTNILQYTSEDIAWLYKKHWDIELFFKWIKQNLKIKRFIGHSLNAVMMQIVSAIITFIIAKTNTRRNQNSLRLIKNKEINKTLTCKISG